MRFIMFNFVVIGALVYLVGGFPGDDIQSDNPVQQTQAEPAPVSIDLIAAPQQDRQVKNAAVDALVTLPEAAPAPDPVPDVTRGNSEMAALPADMVEAEAQESNPAVIFEDTSKTGPEEPNFGATVETSAIEPPPLESPAPPQATDTLPELEEAVSIAPVVLPPEPVLFAPAVADAGPVLAEGATFMTPSERRRELDNLILDMEGVFLDSLRN